VVVKEKAFSSFREVVAEFMVSLEFGLSGGKREGLHCDGIFGKKRAEK
jgi:hypothetical protein